MRGLKLSFLKQSNRYKQSHLLQMRGLKLCEEPYRRFGTVASFTDAWIETYQVSEWEYPDAVASFTDAWIETVWLWTRPMRN